MMCCEKNKRKEEGVFHSGVYRLVLKMFSFEIGLHVNIVVSFCFAAT